jgi:hypothetical protein
LGLSTTVFSPETVRVAIAGIGGGVGLGLTIEGGGGGGVSAACTDTAAVALSVITGRGPVAAKTTKVLVTLPVTRARERG